MHDLIPLADGPGSLTGRDRRDHKSLDMIRVYTRRVDLFRDHSGASFSDRKRGVSVKKRNICIASILLMHNGD